MACTSIAMEELATQPQASVSGRDVPRDWPAQPPRHEDVAEAGPERGRVVELVPEQRHGADLDDAKADVGYWIDLG